MVQFEWCGNHPHGAAMKTLVTTPPVDIALRTLDAEDRRRVHAWFDHLRNWDSDSFVRTHSFPLKSVEGVYVFRTSSDLRIFFRFDGDTITVLDLATKQAILAMAGRTE